MEEYPHSSSCLLFRLGSDVYTGFRGRQLPACLCAAGPLTVPRAPISSALPPIIYLLLLPTVGGHHYLHLEVVKPGPRIFYNLPQICPASNPKLFDD